jgi:structural maintenance of chromosome 1
MHDDKLVSDAILFETRVENLKVSQLEVDEKLKGCVIEKKYLQETLNGLENEVEVAKNSIVDLEEKIDEIDVVIMEHEQRVFPMFCQKVGIENIREYEELSLKNAQETASKRLEYVGGKSKLENIINFDERRLDVSQKRIEKLEQVCIKLEQNLKEFEEKKQEIESSIEEIIKEQAEMKKSLKSAKKSLSEQKTIVENYEKDLEKLEHENESTSKNQCKMDQQTELLRAEKISIIKKCKLEEIQIPIENADIENIMVDDLQVFFG